MSWPRKQASKRSGRSGPGAGTACGSPCGRNSRMMIDSARHNDNNRGLSATIEIVNMASRTVLFIGYDGVGLLDLTGPFTVFWSASWFLTQRGEPPYERRVATVTGGPVATADGITLMAEPLSNFDSTPIDTLVVPGALDL